MGAPVLHPWQRDLRDRTIAEFVAGNPDLTQRRVADLFKVGVGVVREAVRKHSALAEASVEVPEWVPPELHRDYRLIAVDDGEEAAAAFARRAKRNPVLAGPCEHGAR